MKKYKSTLIKVAIAACLVVFVSTETGRQYADQVKPIIDLILD
jgi:hypothetical protein